MPNGDRTDWIEITWAVMGDRIRLDHGYRLYSALIERNPALKGVDWQLLTINGDNTHDGYIKLGRKSRMGVRLALTDSPLLDGIEKYCATGGGR